MPDQDQADVRLVLARLRQEHEDYDAAINAMMQTNCEALRIQRMKKKKLIIKDKMTQIEDQIIPDIIA
ncbi:YdcH family protein [Agrobacterium sp. CG674]